MSFDILETIQSKSREEWQEQLLGWGSDARAWAQNNGDFACIGGFLAGVLIVIFYKFVAAVLAIGVIAGFVFFQIALPASEARKNRASMRGNGAVSTNGVAAPEEPSVSSEAEPVESTSE